MNEKYDLGYASLAEFVKDSLRKMFEEIRSTRIVRRDLRERGLLGIRSCALAASCSGGALT